MITIQLGEGKLPEVTYEKDGAKRSFQIDHNTLFQFINNNCYKEKVVNRKDYDQPVFETPALPPNTVKYMSLPDGKVALFMEKKAFSFNVKYHETLFENVPYPSLLFMFIFAPGGEGYKLQTKKCFTFKDKVLRDSTRLYQYPFSHVQSDGTMCFFFMQEVKDLAQMTSFIHNWLSVSTTDHYYSERHTNKWGWPLRQIFNQTQGQPRFDDEKLMETNFTLKDLVKQQVNMYYPQV